jgi:hypothetical protein
MRCDPCASVLALNLASPCFGRKLKARVMIELHLQQNLLLLCFEPYKRPKTTKLNPNTHWMKQNYYKKKTLIIIVSYLP